MNVNETVSENPQEIVNFFAFEFEEKYIGCSVYLNDDAYLLCSPFVLVKMISEEVARAMGKLPNKFTASDDTFILDKGL